MFWSFTCSGPERTSFLPCDVFGLYYFDAKSDFVFVLGFISVVFTRAKRTICARFELEASQIDLLSFISYALFFVL